MKFLKKALLWLGVLAVIGVGGAAIGLRTVDHDPAEWHIDPSIAERTGRPNDYVVAPEGATKAKIDRIAKVHATDPRTLLFQFDVIAKAHGADPMGTTIDDMWITYVHRTALFGFPDYISVKAVPEGDGAALIVWSRSRYGHSDLGVNKERIDSWLAQLGGEG